MNTSITKFAGTLTLYVLLAFCVASWADDYSVAAEDVLNITVYDEPELSVDAVRVSTSGTISLPLIGKISVGGLTTDRIAARIRDELADGYLKNPRVSVGVKEYRQFFVHGAVNEPGGYGYQEGLTVQKAVVLAGGFSERASEGKISLVRETDPGVSVRVTINQQVRPGDVITVGESFF